MANNYFKFKKFIIYQNEEVFKVNTDGVLLAAWSEMNQPRNVLEIGCGTGVLCFMMAQKFPNAQISGIDIHRASIDICKLNLKSNFPYFQQIEFVLGDIKTWKDAAEYDCIISNPPFFENDTVSSSLVEQIARHSTELDKSKLCDIIFSHLSTNGNAFIIFPFEESSLLEMEFQRVGLFINERCFVKPRKNKSFHRVMYKLSKAKKESIIDTELIILDENGYTEAYVNLCTEFYL